MSQNRVSRQLGIEGMFCRGCEVKLEKMLKSIEGVISVKASYNSKVVGVTYDEGRVKLAKIKQAITELGYEVVERYDSAKPSGRFSLTQLAVTSIIILGVSMVISHFGGFDFFNYFPEAKTGMSLAAIFVIGLLTSVHCVGMCGGICLSQCVNSNSRGNEEGGKARGIRPSLLYNLGRVISYTVIGGIVGAVGSIVSASGVLRGAVALIAGVSMVVMGLNMLDIFPPAVKRLLGRLSLRMPKFLIGAQGKSNSPFYVGLLNGLMPCGPLQAMQLYALSTGSPIQGALSMFLFSLGTVPLMFGFGAASSLLTKRFTSKLMAVSAVIVIVLGISMFNTGLSMSGFLGIGTQQSSTADLQPEIVDGYQVVKIEVSRRGYEAITVKKDIPVRFNLHAEEENLNGCNYAIVIPKFGIEMVLNEGDNIVEFTPTEAGVIPYSCWMNMIRSSITVVD